MFVFLVYLLQYAPQLLYKNNTLVPYFSCQWISCYIFQHGLFLCLLASDFCFLTCFELMDSVAEPLNHVLEILSGDATFVHPYTLLHRLLIAILLLNSHPSFGIFYPTHHHYINLTWCCVVLLTDTNLSSERYFHLKYPPVSFSLLSSIVDWYSQSLIAFSSVAILHHYKHPLISSIYLQCLSYF